MSPLLASNATLRSRAELLIIKTSTIDDQVDDSIAEERMIVKLSGLFSLLALLLASVGLYGVMSYAVTRKTREIGIRMALGAKPSQVRLAVLRINVDGHHRDRCWHWYLIGYYTLYLEFVIRVGHYDLLTISVATVLLIAVALIATICLRDELHWFTQCWRCGVVDRLA